MKRRTAVGQPGNVPALALAAGVIFSVISLFGIVIVPISTDMPAHMHLTPETGSVAPGDTFTVRIIVDSIVPVNVFSGELTWDSSILYVEGIDYNTSIADLWAERPWYENGDGTLNFSGGTTIPGGFVGNGELITITFGARAIGEARLVLKDAHIHAHDGLGTDIPLEDVVNATYTIKDMTDNMTNLVTADTTASTVHIIPAEVSTDLNADGKRSLQDVSIFMTHLASGNGRSDFNADGSVSIKDLSILLDTLNK